jgi:sigma-E factor negative regulatory protein RseB
MLDPSKAARAADNDIDGCHGAPLTRRRLLLTPAAALAVAAFGLARPALADEVGAWLARATAAARDLNYVGTIVYQHGSRVETSRLVHLRTPSGEQEKLVNLDGPAREVIRIDGDVRCYYPDAKILRIEPRTFRNAFPSLSAQQQKTLSEYYDFRKAESGRVGGYEAQAWVFEPKDGMRYGHKFWADVTTGLLLKARIVNERDEVVEQFAFTDLSIGAKVDREMVRPTWNALPPDWQVQQAALGEIEAADTGWLVGKLPPGFTKIAEGRRALRGRREPVAHLVFSDGLVSVSVFVEAIGGTPRALGPSQQGGINIFVRPVDDKMITVLGEVPGVTVRQIANSVTRR